MTVKVRNIAVKLECAQAAACEGDAGASATAGKGGPKGVRLAGRGKTVKLAKADYFIDPGAAERVKLKLTRSGRTLFREQAKARAKLVLRSAEGERSNTTLTLRKRR